MNNTNPEGGKRPLQSFWLLFSDLDFLMFKEIQKTEKCNKQLVKGNKHLENSLKSWDPPPKKKHIYISLLALPQKLEMAQNNLTFAYQRACSQREKPCQGAPRDSPREHLE